MSEDHAELLEKIAELMRAGGRWKYGGREMSEDHAELLEKIAELMRAGAIYQGWRPQGHNTQNEYLALLFRVPKTGLVGGNTVDEK